jgi:hypothetical protein
LKKWNIHFLLGLVLATPSDCRISDASLVDVRFDWKRGSSMSKTMVREVGAKLSLVPTLSGEVRPLKVPRRSGLDCRQIFTSANEVVVNTSKSDYGGLRGSLTCGGMNSLLKILGSYLS